MSRFSCASTSLELGVLSKKTRGVLRLALVLALTMHGALTRVGDIGEQATVVKPLTTQFIKRAPRLTKPLELRRRPRPRRQHLKREMVAVKARASRGERLSAFQPSRVLHSLTGPTVTVDRGYTLGSSTAELGVVAGVIEGTREPKEKLSMALELMDVETLDTGRCHAMVIQDPVDKRNIRGFFHIAVVHPTSITNQDMGWINMYVVPGLVALAGAMNRYTGIKTDVRGKFPFNAGQIFDTPWIYIRYGIKRGATTDVELEVLGAYALSGGFVYMDSYGIREDDNSAFVWLVTHSLELNGYLRGRHWEFEQTFSDHPLYHCFFDFQDLPAGGHGAHYLCNAGYVVPMAPYLDTVSISGRMVMMLSHQWLGYAWGNWPASRIDNTRQLQFGVNLLVFALTQEGSVTNRVMDTVGGR